MAWGNTKKCLVDFFPVKVMRTSNFQICVSCSHVWGLKSTSAAAITSLEKRGIEEKINLQSEGDKAKPYQVRQVRNIVLKYKLGGE